MVKCWRTRPIWKSPSTWKALAAFWVFLWWVGADEGAWVMPGFSWLPPPRRRSSSRIPRTVERGGRAVSVEEAEGLVDAAELDARRAAAGGDPVLVGGQAGAHQAVAVVDGADARRGVQGLL